MIHIEETTFQAKTVEECLSQAENEFSISKDKLKYTIIQEPREGFLGIGKNSLSKTLSSPLSSTKNIIKC